MKRIVYLLLALCCALPLCACGENHAENNTSPQETDNKITEEPFTLRSGIMFGDTVDEVKQKEKKLQLVEESGNIDTILLHYEGEIAGLDGKALFIFDGKEKALNELCYIFDSESMDEITKTYKTIKESCNRQYGEPTSDVFFIDGDAYGTAQYQVKANIQQGITSEIVSNEEWIVNRDNGDIIKIDEVIYYGKTSKQTIYDVIVTYYYITKEQLVANAVSSIVETNKTDSEF